MRHEITIDFLRQPPDRVMRILERRGEWTGESDIYNTGYCAIKKGAQR